MTFHRRFVLACLLTVSAGEVRAQGGLLPGPYGFGGYFSAGGFSYSRRGLRFSAGFLGGRLYRCAPFGPYCAPWCGPGPGSYGRVTIFSVVTPPPPPPPLVFVSAPTVVFPGLGRIPRDEPPPEIPQVPEPPPPPPVPPPEQPRKDPPRKADDDPFERPPPEPADPRDEAGRLIHLGREAFRRQEYGRAAQRFRQAARLDPGAALPHFLLAQALQVQGKYHEAYDAILAGLARQPDWPAAAQRPLDLYDDVVEYSQQLRVLEEMVLRHPNDPVLLFLYAGALWSDGRREEAGAWFRRAQAAGADAAACERYLLELPAGETL